MQNSHDDEKLIMNLHLELVRMLRRIVVPDKPSHIYTIITYTYTIRIYVLYIVQAQLNMVSIFSLLSHRH